jgi:hypothetical protein
MPEKGDRIGLRYLAQRLDNCLRERFGRPRADAAQHALYLGNRHLDWRQVRRVGRQEPQVTATRRQQLRNLRCCMGTQVIYEYDLPRPQRRPQYVFDVACKCGAVRATGHLHAWPHPVWKQRGDDGLIGRCVAWNAATGALAERGTCIAPAQIQIAAELVDNHEVVGILLGDLDLKGGTRPGISLAGAQRLFFREMRSRAIARLIVQREREVPYSRAQVAMCSGKVASGEATS